MDEKIMKRAIRTYNGIMEATGYEHNQIGTWYSENTENWNLRDMVAECDYTLSTYYEEGHCNCDLKEYEPNTWRKHTTRLKNFIKRYEPYIKDMKCYEGHCSGYDF